MEYKISLIVPCYLRPQRTLRALDCILNQDMNGWEAWIVGDGCPNIEKMIDDGDCIPYEKEAYAKGNKIHFVNKRPHKGGWGYHARNFAISTSKGKYIMFMDNDDFIKNNHFSHYYNSIVGTNNDMMYFDTWLNPIENRGGINGRLREAKLKFGDIGHHEIIAKSEVLKALPPQTDKWGHDWELVKNMMDSGCKIEKGFGEPTYLVMSVGELREQNID